MIVSLKIQSGSIQSRILTDFQTVQIVFMLTGFISGQKTDPNASLTMSKLSFGVNLLEIAK